MFTAAMEMEEGRNFIVSFFQVGDACAGGECVGDESVGDGKEWLHRHGCEPCCHSKCRSKSIPRLLYNGGLS